jgi:hypothetical protein
MAWGIWNKILNGIKTGFNVVKRILPIAASVGKNIADKVQAYSPGSKIGGYIGKVSDMLGKGNDLVSRLGGGGSGQL